MRKEQVVQDAQYALAKATSMLKNAGAQKVMEKSSEQQKKIDEEIEQKKKALEKLNRK
jgi:hypothetical protein